MTSSSELLSPVSSTMPMLTPTLKMRSFQTNRNSPNFNVLAARDTLEAGQAAHDAIGRQLEQSEKRFEVGLIAVTDVQDAEGGVRPGNGRADSGQAQPRDLR